ncbi:GTP pyrophosphokinase [Halobacillus salinus]|uniref:GTP pyrophosphokinase n=1 Tax=Halobacillus salinus TaxID=192814 RepID=UPI001590C0CE|nr:hypothetical protein [Halobacillus salinus]
MVNEIVTEYTKKKEIFQGQLPKIKALLLKIAEQANVELHDIYGRIKEEESLIKKVRDKNKYKELSDITDVIGLRIITFFNDDVDKLAEEIENQFVIDTDNSVDKRKNDPDRFGYQSLHYIVAFDDDRTSLPEYSDLKHVFFEIQIRSILQHAWAEIEHDLGYKSKIEVPSEIRRDFSRISGLLELADKEFIRIKNYIENYEDEVKGEMEKRELNIEINKNSLATYITKSSLVRELDIKLGEIGNASSIEYNELFVTKLLRKLKYLELKTIDELEELLSRYYDVLLNFVEAFVGDRGFYNGVIHNGISVFHLCYILVSIDSDEKEVKDYLREFYLGGNSDHDETAEEILEIVSRVN